MRPEASERRATMSKRGLRSLSTLLLAPRFPELIPTEFYRLTGMLRLVVALGTIVSTLPVGFFAPSLGFDGEVYWRIWGVNAAALLVDAALALWLWRGTHTSGRQGVINRASAVLELGTLLLFIYGTGSVNSGQTVYAIILVIVYRSAFDFRTGASAFGILFVGLWSVVLLEVFGVLPPQPLALGGVDRYYEDGGIQLASMMVTSTGILTAFVTANWMVARLRHQELAMRDLRRHLAEEDDGVVGRHTGRRLADTYEIGGLIGAGGIGEVYRARHVRTGRDVAVKMLREQYLGEDLMLARFRREAEILGRLGNPNILEVIDVGEEDGHPFIVVELLEGESLQDRLDRDGPLPMVEIAVVVGHVAAGLDVAHAAGIVHRDLKPDNIFLTHGADGGVAKVLDFGIAKIRNAAATMTNEGQILGTPAFMSPEQASGRTREVDARTDVYALGAVAYACLTGRQPFEGGTLPNLIFKVITAEAEAPHELRPEVPVAASATVARAMAKKPDERFESASDFADALIAALGVERAGASLPPPGPRPHTVDEGAPTVERPAPAVDEKAETLDAQREPVSGDAITVDATDPDET